MSIALLQNLVPLLHPVHRWEIRGNNVRLDVLNTTDTWSYVDLSIADDKLIVKEAFEFSARFLLADPQLIPKVNKELGRIKSKQHNAPYKNQ